MARLTLYGHRGEDIAVLPLAQLAARRHIDLLVLATQYEELPSVLLKGMAAGLPVIARQVGPIPALVDHDVNGVLVPPDDPRLGGGHYPRPGRAGHRRLAGRSRPAGSAAVRWS